MVAASRCFGARSLVQGGGLPNARRACHSSNLLGPLGRCSGVYCFLGSTGGCCVIGREHFLRGSSSSFDALRGCYTLSRGNATSERERMGGVKRCSFYKHMNGFLSDSSLARWNGGAGESVRMLLLLLLAFSEAPTVLHPMCLIYVFIFLLHCRSEDVIMQENRGFYC